MRRTTRPFHIRNSIANPMDRHMCPFFLPLHLINKLTLEECDAEHFQPCFFFGMHGDREQSFESGSALACSTVSTATWSASPAQTVTGYHIRLSSTYILRLGLLRGHVHGLKLPQKRVIISCTCRVGLQLWTDCAHGVCWLRAELETSPPNNFTAPRDPIVYSIARSSFAAKGVLISLSMAWL